MEPRRWSRPKAEAIGSSLLVAFGCYDICARARKGWILAVEDCRRLRKARARCQVVGVCPWTFGLHGREVPVRFETPAHVYLAAGHLAIGAGWGQRIERVHHVAER